MNLLVCFPIHEINMNSCLLKKIYIQSVPSDAFCQKICTFSWQNLCSRKNLFRYFQAGGKHFLELAQDMERPDWKPGRKMWNCSLQKNTKRKNTQKLRWEYLVRKRISSSLVNPVLLKHIREILHYWVPTCNSLVISGQKVGWKKWDIWQKAEQLKMGSLWSLNPYGQLRRAEASWGWLVVVNSALRHFFFQLHRLQHTPS